MRWVTLHPSATAPDPHYILQQIVAQQSKSWVIPDLIPLDNIIGLLEYNFLRQVLYL